MKNFVKFSLHLSCLENPSYRSLLQCTIGMSRSEMDEALHQYELFKNTRTGHLESTDGHCDMWLLTTPERFVRFLVKRNDLGFTNQWKALNVELLEVKDTPDYLKFDLRDR